MITIASPKKMMKTMKVTIFYFDW